MKKADLPVFCCPKCKKELFFTAIRACSSIDAEDVLEGDISCNYCSRHYPVRNGIPRFVPDNDYADSFGFQWRRFHSLLQGKNQKEGARIRFNATTHWPEELEGQKYSRSDVVPGTLPRSLLIAEGSYIHLI